MDNVTAIIPARFASTRFPGKPLADIAGKPLIARTLENSAKCPLLDRVVVATDDERIARAVEKYGGEACMTSGSHFSGTDRVAEAARKLGLAPDSLVVNIQGDEPLVEPGAVGKLLEPLLRERGFQMSTLSYRIRKKEEINNPDIVKVVCARDGAALYFSRALIPFSAGAGGLFYKHIGLYAYRAEFLEAFTRLPPSPLEGRERLEQLRALENGFRIAVTETDSDPVEVDTPGDVAKVLKELSRREKDA